MAKPISIPNTFAGSTSAIPLVYLDQDFTAVSNATNDLATYSNYVTDTGVADAYIANYPANIVTTTVTAGLRLQFKAANANTGASTLQVQVNSVSIGSGSIRLTDGTAIAANTIVANAIVDVQYDGTNFQLLSDSSGGKEVITDLTVSGNLAVTGTTNLTGVLTANVANITTSTITTGNITTANITTANVTTMSGTTSYTGTQTFTGSTTAIAAVFQDAAEVTTISATAATGTINYDVTTQSVLYYTSNASANWTVNVRGNGTTSLNTLMSTGQAVTVVFLVTQGSTAYYNNAFQIDGSSVTPKYQGGTAWTSGNASGIDAYSYTIVKTGSAAFTVFAAQTQFK
jgi:hypothetical protein